MIRVETKEAATEAATSVVEIKATNVVAEALVENSGATTVLGEEVAATSVGAMATTRIHPIFPSDITPPNIIILSLILGRHI